MKLFFSLPFGRRRHRRRRHWLNSNVSCLLWRSAHKTTSTDRPEEWGRIVVENKQKRTCVCVCYAGEVVGCSKQWKSNTFWWAVIIETTCYSVGMTKMTLCISNDIFRYILVHLFSASHTQNNRKYSTLACTKEVVFICLTRYLEKETFDTSIETVDI